MGQARGTSGCSWQGLLWGLAALLSLVWLPSARPAAAHGTAEPLRVGLAGKKLLIKHNGTPKKNSFAVHVKRQIQPQPANHDPALEGLQLLVRRESSPEVRSELITLDPSLWKQGGSATNPWFKYRDKTAARGGVRKATIRNGQIRIAAKGENWYWNLTGPYGAAWVHVYLGNEEFCMMFGGTIKKDEPGRFMAKDSSQPSACPDAVCGNGRVEGSEECDDGNLDPNDLCANDCTSLCTAPEFDSTFEAIQAVIFDEPAYGCGNVLCHGGAPGQGLLDLSAGNSYDSLVGVPSTISPGTRRVEPGEHELSVLWDKLRAGTEAGLPDFGGVSMPVAATALSPEHLEALSMWIRGGAPRDLVVEGTSPLLATCLGDPDPLVIVPPDPPGAGVGVQLRQTPRPLVGEAESEICMSIYYDFTQTELAPEWARQSCDLGLANNPSGECIVIHRRILAQDPQSHHSILHIYRGASDTTHPAWGEWTYKFRDDANPLQGQPCDPLAVDPNVGYNPNCSSAVVASVGCAGYGPPDAGIFFASNFLISQEVYFNQEFPDGIYQLIPMTAIFTFNSHAFNTHPQDSHLDEYLNLEFAEAADQQFPMQDIFDISAIFIADVPPFETREYCHNYTLPSGSNLFRLTTHTHQRGVHFRIWEPPNAPCAAGSCPEGAPSQFIYESFQYNDPIQLYFDPPVLYNGSTQDRTFRYCSKYDNGSTPSSPPVKTASNPLGSSCPVSSWACMDGPNKGVLCAGDDAFCDSTLGAGDGLCDACPVRGGVTTEDEMFVLLGSYF